MRNVCGNDLINPEFNSELRSNFEKDVPKEKRTRRAGAKWLTLHYKRVEDFPKTDVKRYKKGGIG